MPAAKRQQSAGWWEQNRGGADVEVRGQGALVARKAAGPRSNAPGSTLVSLDGESGTPAPPLRTFVCPIRSFRGTNRRKLGGREQRFATPKPLRRSNMCGI